MPVFRAHRLWGFGLYPCTLDIRVNVAVALTCLAACAVAFAALVIVVDFRCESVVLLQCECLGDLLCEMVVVL